MYLYSYTAELQRGFKHRYGLLINGTPTIDYSTKYSKNSLGNLTNFIIVPHKEFDKEESKLAGSQTSDLSMMKLPTFVPSQAKLERMEEEERKSNVGEQFINLAQQVTFLNF